MFLRRINLTGKPDLTMIHSDSDAKAAVENGHGRDFHEMWLRKLTRRSHKCLNV